MGPSIKYVTLFWTNFDLPLPVTHCHTSRDPLKCVTHLETSQFLVVHAYILCIYRGFVLVHGGFVRGFLSRGFWSGMLCSGWFLSVPLLSEYICCNRKVNITFNFRFHMYEKISKV